MQQTWSTVLRGAVLLSLLLPGCKQHTEPTKQNTAPPSGEVQLGPNSPQLSSITVEPVRRRTEKVVAVLPAQLVVNEDHTVRIFSPVTGRVTHLQGQPGEWVDRGAPLADIASGDAAQVSSDLSRATAAATLGAATLARAQNLYTHHVIALKDLEQARSDDAQAGAELARSQARAKELGTGTTINGDFVLRAPLEGDIIDRTANPGAEVRPDAQTSLFTISDLRTLWLTAAAYQQDLATVHRGQRLAFTTTAAPSRRFVGIVSYVGNVLDPTTRTVILRAVLPNADRTLRPQTFGEARLLAPDTSRLPVIPTTALVTHGSATVVFIERSPGQFVRRVVTVGDDDGTTASITAGLHVGERVVTRGSILLGAEADAHAASPSTP